MIERPFARNGLLFLVEFMVKIHKLVIKVDIDIEMFAKSCFFLFFPPDEPASGTENILCKGALES